MRFSTAYIQHLKNGPFPGRLDPWAEAGRYFQQIHSGMIDEILRQIQDPLLSMGYIAGKEASLQVLEGRQPDVFVQRTSLEAEHVRQWDYETAAAEILAEPGIAAESAELLAIHIKDRRSSDLVTVVELISPRNKTEPDQMAQYQDRRSRLLINQGVNVVEIDLTRSVKRLFQHELTAHHPYLMVVYLPETWPRVIHAGLNQPLKRLALPLRADVIPVELQSAYDEAYRSAAVAGQILNANGYGESELPFPSLLTDDQRQMALDRVAEWQTQLAQLG
jgi:hypothetical protein